MGLNLKLGAGLRKDRELIKMIGSDVEKVPSTKGGGMDKRVMTVRGPISSSELGVTLMHEHFAFAFPGWYADDSLAPYDREEVETKCLAVLKGVKDAGIKTIVDATPADVGGRDPILLRSLSEKSGINIIAVTGIYTENGGASGYYKWQSTMGGRDLEEDLYELFLKELTVGIGKSGVKAGLIKVATSDPAITEYEETIIKAAVRVSKETAVPIITHTDAATVGPAQQDLFLKLGANPLGVMIGHQNNAEDIGYPLSELQKPGFYIAFDRTNPLMSLKGGGQHHISRKAGLWGQDHAVPRLYSRLAWPADDPPRKLGRLEPTLRAQETDS